MNKHEIAKVLEDVAFFLLLKGENPSRTVDLSGGRISPRATRNFNWRGGHRTGHRLRDY